MGVCFQPLEVQIVFAGSEVLAEIDRSHPNRVWWSGWATDAIGYVEIIE